MIPIHEFVALLRSTLDQELVGVERQVVDGGCLNLESAEETALYYAGAIGRLKGLRKARESLDELVKKVNEGGV